jgi:glutamate-1-semialdehyde aminotransferase/aryl-alcohol dehydrogenase-like predicted oxidoreductase
MSEHPSKVILGCAQLGMDYGIANLGGRPSDSECERLLKRAVEGGVLLWDTAPAYGDSEKRIGDFLAAHDPDGQVKISTKLSALPDGLEGESEIADWVDREITLSLERLKKDQVHALLLHRAEDLQRAGQPLLDAMRREKERGRVAHLGISAYGPDEALLALEREEIEWVQVPLNLLDVRLHKSGVLESLEKAGKKVFARSIHLQGAFFIDPVDLDPHLRAIGKPLEVLKKMLARADLELVQGALLFVLTMPGISGAVVGVDGESQLEEHLDALAQKMPPDLVEEMLKANVDLPVEVLEPRHWPAPSKTRALGKKAAHLIAGKSQLLSKKPERFAPGDWPSHFSRAAGARVWDLDENAYVDCSYSGIGACPLGFAHPDVDGAVKGAIESGNFCTLNPPEEVALAERLVHLHPWAEQARFARTGGEAMAMAVRVARAITGKDKVAFCGYHGWSDWYLAANLADEKNLDGHLLPGLAPSGVPRALKGSAIPFAFNDQKGFETIVAEHGDTLAAVIMEPRRSQEPDPAFLQSCREKTQALGIPLIVDEITAGFRQNAGGLHLTLDLEPDLAVFGKALGNGHPISALIGTRGVMAGFERSFISSTYWTDRVGPVAALAVLDVYERQDVPAKLEAAGNRVRNAWQNAARTAGFSLDIQGIPALSTFSFAQANEHLATAYTRLMLKAGYLAGTAFYATTAHTGELCAAHEEACLAAFQTLALHKERGTLNEIALPLREKGFGRLA